MTKSEWRVASTAAGPVEQSVDELIESLTGQTYENYVSSASRLYQQILEPVDDVLVDKDLIIVPHGVLYNVPFETLLFEDVDVPVDSTALSYSTLPYLVRRHAVSYTYSATLRDILGRRKSSPVDRQFLGIAPIEYTSTTKPDRPFPGPIATLEGAGTEVKSILNLFSPPYRPILRRLSKRSTVSLGRRASEQAIVEMELNRYRYIHFATHGLVNDSIPELSGLMMHPSSEEADDILHLGEIYGMDLNADLVVLSACETGKGKFVTGSGVVGLTGGFLYAGARNVVVSLWQVDDFSAATLMKPFYIRFLRQADYRQALRFAKLEMIASEGRHSRPYFWAPFILFDS
ncbi:MAG: CHAT domain-containing protein [Rhodothermales bacterium]|nr:CHAT domain-containing protein [Rhodothermales bacterium]